MAASDDIISRSSGDNVDDDDEAKHNVVKSNTYAGSAICSSSSDYNGNTLKRSKSISSIIEIDQKIQ